MKFIFFILTLLLSVDSWALNVSVKAKTDGAIRPTVKGSTNLPDGTELMISIRRKESNYFAQDKVTVSSGTFQAGPFSQKGTSLNAGLYSLTVTMPLVNVQPSSTWSVLGKGGANLQGPLAKKSEFGGRFVEYKTSFKVGDGSSAGSDKSARVQAIKDSHEWWLKSCSSNCNLTKTLARNRNEAYSVNSCYEKCVADEPMRR